MQANLPKTITVNSPDGTREIYMPSLTDDVIGYILRYGLQQMLSDCHAAITAKTHPKDAERTEAKLAKFDGKLASLYAGETTQPRAGGGELEREVQALAKATIRDALRKAGRKADKDKTAEMVKTYVGKNREALETQAREIIEARKGATSDVDLEDLGL